MKHLMSLMILAVLGGIPLGGEPPISVENEFVYAYNDWVVLRRSIHPGVIDASEILAWNKVEKRFKTLHTAMKREYGL